MSSLYETIMTTELSGGAYSGFGPISTVMRTPDSTLGRFHPYTGYRVNSQRTVFDAYSRTNYLSSDNTGNYDASVIQPESYLPGRGAYLANALYHHYLLPFNAGTQEAGFQQRFNIKTLQNLCGPTADTGNSFQVSSTTVRKERSHPFYRRKRVEPAEGMTRTRDKYRVVYTEKQRMGLEKEYYTNKFITSERRTELCEELSLSERQIKIWFQNRRAKERRDSSKGKRVERADLADSSRHENNTNSTCAQTLAQNDFSTSCRFAGNNCQLEENPDSFRQCRFRNYSTLDSLAGNMLVSLNECHFESRDSGNKGRPVSPSEWSTSLVNNYNQSLQVSPLTAKFNFDCEPRL